MKKLLTTCCLSLLLIFALSMSVFAEDLQEIDSYSDYDVDAFLDTAQGYFQQMITAEDEVYAQYLEQYADNAEVHQGFEAVDQLRQLDEEFVDFGPYNLYQTEEGEPRFYQILHFDKNDYVFIIGFDSSLTWNYCNAQKVTYRSDQDENALLDLSNCKLKDIGNSGGFTFTFDGETLKGALRNAIIGILVVFCMLVFISLIISLFKYLPSPEKRAMKEKAAQAAAAAPASPVNEAPAPVQKTEDVSDDTQLAAVIAAAVAAYEGKSADSFIVRTINKRTWK